MTETPAAPWSSASEANAAAPSGGDGPQFNTLVGKTLLITPTAYKEDVKTPYNEHADMIEADVVVIAPSPEDCVEYRSMGIFQGRLIRALKPKVGMGIVLGKLIRHEDEDNKPYDLVDATPEADAAARAYYAQSVQPPF